MPSRWFGVSMKPPVPGVDASRKVSGETHSALPVVRMTWFRATPRSAQPPRVDLDLQLALALPQMATLATPGTPISRGRIVQRASTDMSMGDRSVGGQPHHHHPARRRQRLEDRRRLRHVAAARAPGVSRSCTTWRASSRSVPGSKTITIDDSPGTDSRADVVEQRRRR